MFIAPIILTLIAFTPQDDAPKLKAAFEQAKMCSEATVKGDIAKLVDFTHPAGVKLVGGREKMIEIVTKSMAEMKANGFKFDESKVEPAKTITKDESGLYCILPTMAKMTINGQKISINSYLLGASSDNGKSWTFLDGSAGEEGLRQVLPEIPKSMKLPAKAKPKVEG